MNNRALISSIMNSSIINKHHPFYKLVSYHSSPPGPPRQLPSYPPPELRPPLLILE